MGKAILAAIVTLIVGYLGTVVELAMEGIRYWDLLRWGIAHEVLQGKIYGAPFPGRVKVDGDNSQWSYRHYYQLLW